MVIDIGAAVSGDFTAVGADVAAVRSAIGGDVVLKVIVESAALLSIVGEDALVSVSRTAADAGADFVKTSTGFHPAGAHRCTRWSSCVGLSARVSRSRPVAAYVRRPMRCRCSRPARPGWDCLGLGRCWTD